MPQDPIKDELVKLQIGDLNDLAVVFMQLFSSKKIDETHSRASKYDISAWMRDQLDA